MLAAEMALSLSVPACMHTFGCMWVMVVQGAAGAAVAAEVTWETLDCSESARQAVCSVGLGLGAAARVVAERGASDEPDLILLQDTDITALHLRPVDAAKLHQAVQAAKQKAGSSGAAAVGMAGGPGQAAAGTQPEAAAAAPAAAAPLAQGTGSQPPDQRAKLAVCELWHM